MRVRSRLRLPRWVFSFISHAPFFGLYREVVDGMDDGWMDTRHRWAKRRKQKFLSGKKKKKKTGRMGFFLAIWGDIIGWTTNADRGRLMNTGRAAREEEEPQGPRHEAPKVHPPFRQRHHDRWQAEGTLIDTIQSMKKGGGAGSRFLPCYRVGHIESWLRLPFFIE